MPFMYCTLSEILNSASWHWPVLQGDHSRVNASEHVRWASGCAACLDVWWEPRDLGNVFDGCSWRHPGADRFLQLRSISLSLIDVSAYQPIHHAFFWVALLRLGIGAFRLQPDARVATTDGRLVREHFGGILYSASGRHYVNCLESYTSVTCSTIRIRVGVKQIYHIFSVRQVSCCLAVVHS